MYGGRKWKDDERVVERRKEREKKKTLVLPRIGSGECSPGRPPPSLFHPLRMSNVRILRTRVRVEPDAGARAAGEKGVGRANDRPSILPGRLRVLRLSTSLTPLIITHRPTIWRPSFMVIRIPVFVEWVREMMGERMGGKRTNTRVFPPPSFRPACASLASHAPTTLPSRHLTHGS